MKHSKKKMYPGGGHFKKKANANMPKQQMKKGGKLKPVNNEDNPGLAKLPASVRNKMGYMAMGGKMKADEDFMYGGKMMKKMNKGGKMSMPGFKGFTGTSMPFMKATGIGPMEPKKARRKKKMMKGGKMNYPGGGRMQHD
jgi:hypothetical protein